MQSRFFSRVLVLLAACVYLASCVATTDNSGLLDQKLESRGLLEQDSPAYSKAIGRPGNSQQAFEGLDNPGTDKLTGRPVQMTIVGGDNGERVKLNLVDVAVPVAAKAVLADALNLNYSIDARVQGTITLQTSRGVSKRELLRLFQGALKGVGATVVNDGQSFRIVLSEDAAQSAAQFDNGEDETVNPGQRSTVIPLRNVSAADISEVIAPLVPKSMVVKTDRRRNVLILNGSVQDIATVRETISVFDVDWMKGMSFALVPVRSSQPAAIVSDLNQIYDTKAGPLRDILRFVPNRRLRSVLVISSRAKYLREAKDWIRKLDVLAEGNEESLHVYKVQNRTAAELAKVLQSVLDSGAATPTSRQQQRRSVAPKLEEQMTGTVGDAGPTSGPETPATGIGSDEDIRQQLQDDSFTLASVDGESAQQVRVVADDANNALLIFATQQDFDRIQLVLEQVDSQPNQVLLEAVIAEVSLDDEMKFGVRWFIGEGKHNGTFSDLASGAVASSFPGFSYFLKANDIGVTINALASVTDVRVLSSPSLLVMDNKSATLQVGDQVPIVSQQAKGTASSDAPIVNSVEMKDTGVILNVTPRVNDSGRVILEIEQEVSSVVKTTTSGIDSPTIRQRKIKTSVVVTDGEALALGGLIQEKETTGQAKVPVLGDVPILKNAFRHKTNGISRTELIIFIRPRVVRDAEEARSITDEFRSELEIQAPRVRREDPTPGSELVRILN